jgi:hypothetical protein
MLLTASSVLARQLDYESQAKSQEEVYRENLKAARPSGQHESYSVSRELERDYENDANRSNTADGRVQTIIYNQYKEAARAKELAGN